MPDLKKDIEKLRKQLGDIEEAEGGQSMKAWHLREKLIRLEQQHNDSKEGKL